MAYSKKAITALYLLEQRERVAGVLSAPCRRHQTLDERDSKPEWTRAPVARRRKQKKAER